MCSLAVRYSLSDFYFERVSFYLTICIGSTNKKAAGAGGKNLQQDGVQDFPFSMTTVALAIAFAQCGYYGFNGYGIGLGIVDADIIASGICSGG